MTDQPEQNLVELAMMRKLVADQIEAVKKYQAYLEGLPEYKNLVAAKTALAEYTAKEGELVTEIKRSKSSVILETITGMNEQQRKEAFTEFKALLPEGLALRVNHSLEYSEQEAIKWCETNATAALKTVLEKKVFETLAETKDIEFVKKIDTPTITIASDLSMYLAGE